MSAEDTTSQTREQSSQKENIMTTATETKRGRGRPASFPNTDTKMAGFNLPEATIELLKKGAERREVTQNILVDRAIRAYVRKG